MTTSRLRFVALLLAGCHPGATYLPAAADYTLPYSFTTLAGTSSIGAQDGTGTAARFYSPRAVALDRAGNAFVIDTGNHTVRKITPAGVVTTFAGLAGVPGSTDGTGAAARFDDPHDLVVDATDNLYVTDTGNHTIRKITPAGVVSTLAGLAGIAGATNGDGTLARFSEPLGLALDPSGNLYVTEAGNGLIRKITPAGVISTFAHDLSFRDPYYYAIAADASGNVCVARYFTRDYHNYYDALGRLLADEVVSDVGYLTKVAPDGTLTYLRQSSVIVHHPEGLIPPINTPFTDVVFTTDGQLLTALNGQILRLAPASGDTIEVVSGSGIPGSADGPAAVARFGGLLGLAVDATGNMAVADSGNNDFRRVTRTGTATTAAGIALDVASGYLDTTGADARFQFPTGVAVDAAGNTYVADSQCIRKVSPAGVVGLIAGAPGAAGSVDGMGTAARFSNPRGVAVDPTGAIFVADYGNHIIRHVSPAGETTTYAGAAGSAGTQDGPATTARFTNPRGVAVDAAGNVYVTEGAVVRKITPAQEVSTLAGNPGVFGFKDGTGSAAEFTLPTGIAVDAGGNVYVTEVAGNTVIARLRKITPAGVVTTLAGGPSGSADGNGTTARFNQPIGLTVDASGNLFIADSVNQTVRRMTPQGAVTTVAGLADAPGSNDGAGADARFYYPQGIAIDATGKLRVSSGTTIRLGQAATGPSLTTQPQGMSAVAGTSVSFSVTASSLLPLTYQWQKNSVAIPGATGTSLSLSAVAAEQAGDYTVVVTNALGSVTSAKATLAVTAAPVVTPPVVSSGGGGGGAPSWWFLAGLGALALARKRRGNCRRSMTAGLEKRHS